MKASTILTGVLCLFAATAAFADININTATADQLKTLDGVGEVRAQAIIAYRKSHDGFDNMSELKQVKGIGNATAKDLADDVTFGNK